MDRPGAVRPRADAPERGGGGHPAERTAHGPGPTYAGLGERAPRPDCIPEPYLGDILSDDIRAIFLNLNPGRPLGDGEAGGVDPRADETGPVPRSMPAGAPQKFSPRSEFGAAIRESGYHAWACSFPYLTTHLNNYGGRFWRRRLAFARDLLTGPGDQPRGATAEPVLLSQIVGMELWPWHSVQWGTLNPELALPALRRLVVGPLTELAFARGPRQAPIIALGQPFTTVLPLLGFRGVPCNAPLPLPSGNRTLHLFRTGIGETSRPILIAVLVNRYQCGPPTPHGKDGGLDLALARKTLRRFHVAV